jgi:hypothetical protein
MPTQPLRVATYARYSTDMQSSSGWILDKNSKIHLSQRGSHFGKPPTLFTRKKPCSGRRH